MARGGSKPGERRGGRKKGVPNKRTAEVEAKLDALGVDPLEGLAELAKWAKEQRRNAKAFSEQMKCAELEGKMHTELASFKHPKRKAIEHDASEGAKVSLLIEG